MSAKKIHLKKWYPMKNKPKDIISSFDLIKIENHTTAMAIAFTVAVNKPKAKTFNDKE